MKEQTNKQSACGLELIGGCHSVNSVLYSPGKPRRATLPSVINTWDADLGQPMTVVGRGRDEGEGPDGLDLELALFLHLQVWWGDPGQVASLLKASVLPL